MCPHQWWVGCLQNHSSPRKCGNWENRRLYMASMVSCHPLISTPSLISGFYWISGKTYGVSAMSHSATLIFSANTSVLVPPVLQTWFHPWCPKRSLLSWNVWDVYEVTSYSILYQYLMTAWITHDPPQVEESVWVLCIYTTWVGISFHLNLACILHPVMLHQQSWPVL